MSHFWMSQAGDGLCLTSGCLRQGMGCVSLLDVSGRGWAVSHFWMSQAGDELCLTSGCLSMYSVLLGP